MHFFGSCLFTFWINCLGLCSILLNLLLVSVKCMGNYLHFFCPSATAKAIVNGFSAYTIQFAAWWGARSLHATTFTPYFIYFLLVLLVPLHTHCRSLEWQQSRSKSMQCNNKNYNKIKKTTNVATLYLRHISCLNVNLLCGLMLAQQQHWDTEYWVEVKITKR